MPSSFTSVKIYWSMQILGCRLEICIPTINGEKVAFCMQNTNKNPPNPSLWSSIYNDFFQDITRAYWASSQCGARILIFHPAQVNWIPRTHTQNCLHNKIHIQCGEEKLNISNIRRKQNSITKYNHRHQLIKKFWREKSRGDKKKSFFPTPYR